MSSPMMGSPVHHKHTTASSLMIDNSLDAATPINANTNTNTNTKKRVNWVLLLAYMTCMFVGGIGGPLVQRLYYMHGGNRKWLMCFLQSAGFPILLIPLAFLHINHRSSPTLIEPRMLFAGAALGLWSGLVNYMYSVGLFYLPVSTLSLLFSTQLAFVAVSSFLIVKQRFTFYSVNTVVLMTLGAVVLALHSSSDRPDGVSKGKYLFGFFITLGGAAASGLLFPGFELAYKRSRKPVTIMVVTQFQFVINLFATLFCLVGMLVNNDFRVIKREGQQFGLGEVKYCVILVALAILWQLSIVGLIGIVHCTTSLFAGISNAILLPILEVASVIAFHERFTGEKGMCLVLCLWGFTSYFIGEYKTSNKKAVPPAHESHQNDV